MNSIPFYSFTYQNEQIKKAYNEFASSFLDKQEYILGSHLELFETHFSKYLKIKYTVGVGNGYDALHLTLKALNVGKGDEVLVPANTFVATALAVINCGAKPVLIDCNTSSYAIDFNQIEYTSKIKAIIPVHLFGMPVDMDQCISIAESNSIPVIEDFAQAHGAEFKDRKVGTFGICNATSFYPIKPLGAIGDGGAVVTDSVELATKIKTIRNYGSLKKYSYESVGINSRLDDFQAGVLDIKLSYLDQWNEKRRQIAALYKLLLKDVGDLAFQEETKESKSVYHIFVITTAKRDFLKMYLEEKGIFTQIHYPIPFHKQQPFEFLNIKKGKLKQTEWLADSMLSLPIYPGLTESQIEYICETIKHFYNRR